MKFPGLEQTLKDLESEIDSINMLHKNWWLAADGAICGACEFVVPALAKRTNAFIDAFARMVRDDNHYAATLFIRPTLEHVLIAVASDEYVGGHHEFAQRIMSGDRIQRLRAASGHLMRERYLVKRLQARLDSARPDLNVIALYDWSNAFVHFGTQQAFSLVDDLADPEDGQSGRIGFALRGPTYEIPRVTQKNVDDWTQCILGIAVMMKWCLEGLIEVRRSWLGHDR